jgi:hypothetical protein
LSAESSIGFNEVFHALKPLYILTNLEQKESPHLLDKSVELYEQEYYKEKNTDKIIRLGKILNKNKLLLEDLT